MAIIYGNMRYSFNGKKRKPLPRKSKKAPRKPQTQAKIPLHARLRIEEMNAHTEKYPSWQGDKLSPCVLEDDSYKDEAKRKYTVAIPYNKGSYQVVPAEDLEHIGK